jgi:hypothetical protein
MKNYIIPTYDLGASYTLEDAFAIVFSEETLLHTHGPSISLSNWYNNQRTSSFIVDVKKIPWLLRHIFCGDKMRVTVEQTREDSENTIKVSNDIKMHFLGNRFFSIKSYFELSKKDDNIFLNGQVICNAYLLPPMNYVAERFIISECKNQVTIYTDIVTNKFKNTTDILSTFQAAST